MFIYATRKEKRRPWQCTGILLVHLKSKLFPEDFDVYFIFDLSTNVLKHNTPISYRNTLRKLLTLSRDRSAGGPIAGLSWVPSPLHSWPGRHGLFNRLVKSRRRDGSRAPPGRQRAAHKHKPVAPAMHSPACKLVAATR